MRKFYYVVSFYSSPSTISVILILRAALMYATISTTPNKEEATSLYSSSETMIVKFIHSSERGHSTYPQGCIPFNLIHNIP